MQVANIVSGFALAAPKLAEIGGKEHIERAQSAMKPYLGTIGIVELVLGIVGLIDRMGIVYIPLMNFGSSYPQALPAILMGLLLGGSTLMNMDALKRFVAILEPHRITLGLIGIAVGLGSILFGCVLCGYWY